jgi:hypothetical protein
MLYVFGFALRPNVLPGYGGNPQGVRIFFKRAGLLAVINPARQWLRLRKKPEFSLYLFTLTLCGGDGFARAVLTVRHLIYSEVKI